MRHFKTPLAAAIVPLFIAAHSALAQVAAPDPAAPSSVAQIEPGSVKLKEPPPGRVSTSVALGGTYAAPADFEDKDGHVSIARGNIDLTFYIPATDKLLLTAGVENEWSFYDFEGAHGLVRGVDKPASEVASLRLNAAARYKLDDDWTLGGGVFGIAAGQPDVALDQATTGGAFFGAKYKVSDTFKVSFGLLVQSQLEDDAMVLPLVGFDWNIDKELMLTLEGTSLNLDWDLDPHWDLIAHLGYQDRAFRLEEHGPIPYGVLRDRRIVLGLQALWTPTVWFSLRGEVGVVAWSELEFDNSRGDELENLKTDPTPYAGLAATFSF